MRLREALDRAHRYSDSKPVAFAAAYWSAVGVVLAPLFYGLNQSAAASVGTLGPVSIALAAVILLISILSISFYIWLNLTNPYGHGLHLSYWFRLYYGIRLSAVTGFGVIALVAFIVWQIGGPN